MIKRRTKHRAFLLSLSLFLILGFQNCKQSNLEVDSSVVSSFTSSDQTPVGRSPASSDGGGTTTPGSSPSPVNSVITPVSNLMTTPNGVMLISNTSQGLVQPLDPSVGRSCFNQDNVSKPLPTTNQAIINVDEEEHVDSNGTPIFTARKCSHYFQYYAGKVFYTDSTGVRQPVTATNCASHLDEINLREGYAPFPVMFRGTKSQLKNGISTFHWDLYGPIVGSSQPLIKTSDAFNLAYIFETPGEYKAVLTVKDLDGNSSTATSTVSVWARDKKTYYVDSSLGDDRNTGLSATLQSGCDPTTATVGTCAGPWKTATRALSELSSAPRTVTSYTDGKYTAEKFCTSPQTVQISQYNAGWFKTYRSQSLISDMVLSLINSDGSKLVFGPLNAQVCTEANLTPTRAPVLAPGDQILFKRGQSFEMDPGLYTLSSYTADVVPDASTSSCAPISGSTNVRCSYESIMCKPTVEIGHWPKNLGVNVGAYGDSNLAKPKIQNVGSANCNFISLNGVGIMNFSMQDLSFDMFSSKVPMLDNQGRPARSVFLSSPSNAINLTFNRVELSHFEQGIVLNNEHGVFVHNAKTYDSNIVHFYIDMGSDVSLENNNFEYAGNHLAYTGMRNAVVMNNVFSKPAFGRTALRVDGAGGVKNPNRYVWVSDNKFLGWIDPRTSAICLKGRCPYADGKRYNYGLVNFGPNAAPDLAIRDSVFTRNIVKDAESLMILGNNENLTVKDNYFSTLDTLGTTRINLSAVSIKRPSRNILFSGNTFIELGNPAVGSIFGMSNYNNPDTVKCDDVPNHEGIKIANNNFYFTGKMRLYHYEAQRQVSALGVTTQVTDLTADQAEAQIKASHTFVDNKIYADAKKPIFQINGHGSFAIQFSQGFNGAYSEGTDPLNFTFRLYSFDGITSRLGLNATNILYAPTNLTPAEPF